MEIGHHQGQGSGLFKLKEWVKSSLFGHTQQFLPECLSCAWQQTTWWGQEEVSEEWQAWGACAELADGAAGGLLGRQ